MNKKMLTGVGTALITPFHNNKVDYECYGKLVERQVNEGVNFLVPLGTTAETPCLTEEEKIKLLKITKERAEGLPLLVGAGSNNTNAVISTVKEYAKYGADAMLIVVPYYNKPTQDGMIKHFTAIADASPKPIVIYNVPGRTGSNMLASTTLELSKHNNIIGIKEASGNYAQISEIIKNAPKDFSVLSGNDDDTLSLMATGGDGVISVASNIAPSLMASLTSLLQKDEIKEARELFYKLMPLFKNCFIESNPIPVKAGMACMGLIENELRSPLFPATENTIQIMKTTVSEL
ncbi:MAG: 4-hydroxy-tetrahydrodipicolinate synthase [Bacteroidales bacterium]